MGDTLLLETDNLYSSEKELEMGCHMGPTEKKLDLWVALKCYTLKLWKVLMSKFLGTPSVIEQQFFLEQVNLPTEIADAYLLSLADFEVQPESKVPDDWDRTQFLYLMLLKVLDGGYSELSA